MWSVYSIYVHLYTNFIYRCVHLPVDAEVYVPGINCGVWGAAAGRNGKTLTLKEA